MENDTLWHSTNSGGISARLIEAIGGLDGVKALTNNITVVAVCDTNQAALQDCRQKNTKLNKDKLVYIGPIIIDEGLKPDPAKVETMVHMPLPMDK